MGYLNQIADVNLSQEVTCTDISVLKILTCWGW